MVALPTGRMHSNGPLRLTKPALRLCQRCNRCCGLNVGHGHVVARADGRLRSGVPLIQSARMDSSTHPELAAALGRIPSGLFIVTARSGAARTAFLASWVQQCSFNPPMLSIGVKCGRPADTLLQAGALLSVNILRTGDSALMKPFAKGVAPDADPYVGVAIEGPHSGAEVLSGALASIDACVLSRSAAGDHVLVMAEVVAGRVHADGGEPWVHVRRNGFSY